MFCFVLFNFLYRRLQLQARLSFCSCTPEGSKRARMRWALLRDAVRSDWWRYGNTLKEGSIRWRAWFDVWRAAARYIAIREILLFHVGYEVLEPMVRSSKYPDKISSSGKVVIDPQSVLSYTMSECLLSDHLDSSSYQEAGQQQGQKASFTLQNSIGKSREEIDTMLTKQQQRRYAGIGQLSLNSVKAAEEILKAAIRTPRSKDRFDVLRESDEALSLPSATVRALYALQLEMDTVLTVNVSAQCRLWTEERHKARRSCLMEGDEATEGPPAVTVPATSSSASDTPVPVPVPIAMLYVAVLDATDLKVAIECRYN